MGRNKSRKAEPPTRTKLKKDPGVPRLPDLKAKVQRDAERSARNAHRHGHAGASLPLATDTAMNTDAPRTLASSLSSLVPSSSLHHELNDASEGDKPFEATRKHFHKHLHTVLSQSDILLLVLDARDPLGCISPSLSSLLQSTANSSSTPKQLIYVLNKVDLVPPDVVRAWLRHLRHTTPTLPFKAQRETGGQNNATVSALMRLIKAYRPGGPKQTLTVGVVGFPNVGKSSIINALKRSKVCSTSPLAGHTTALQSISLEKSLKIIDSPGVIFDDPSSSSTSSSTSLLLRNVLRPTSIPDPTSLIPSILSLAGQSTMQRIYNLPEFSSAPEMLTMIALQSGKLGKGGAPDLEAAARMILGDWSAQKIPWWTAPPEVHEAFVPSTVQIRTATGVDGVGEEGGLHTVVAPGAENVGQAQILNTLGKAFELEGLYGSADSALDGTGNDEDMGIDEAHEEEEEASMDGIDAQDGVGVPMESDDLLSLVPRKRSLSPTASHISDTATIGNQSVPNTPRKKQEEKSWQTRQPKRLRKEVAREEAGHANLDLDTCYEMGSRLCWSE